MSDEVLTETAEEPTTEEPSFDMDGAVEKISAELFPEYVPPTDGPVNDAVVAPVTETTEPVVQAVEPVVADVPKSWPEDMHEHWAGMPPKAKEYWQTREKQMVDGINQYKGDAQYGKSFKDAIAPFEGVLRETNMQPQQAVQYLMNAHVRLTRGTPESRQQAYRELGENLGLTVQPTNGQAPAPIDPNIQALQREQQALRQELTARQQADYQAGLTKVGQEVEVFASDTKAHPHFNEVADDITALLKGGVVNSLQEAYDRAVWMNPVTRAKEVANAQQAEAAKLKENARLDALKAKTAASSNVRSRPSSRTPTEPVGTIEDTIKASLRDLKSRVAH